MAIAQTAEGVRRVAYSPAEAALATGLSRAKVYEELASGRLRSVKSGKRRLIPVGALDEWLESLTNEDQ
ncbi:MAG: helix-turn-helix domain-containing protein [Acidimicrobiales bacterium]